jgi:DNA-binding Lrp family transcriptional regulator
VSVSEYPSRELEMIDQVAKDREALELRLSHMAYQDIADIQGVTVPTVRKRIRRAIQAGIPKETRDQARTLEVTRIDRLQRFNELVIQSAATTLAEKFTAQQAWLAASKVRAALLGLNMPAELEVKYSGALDHEIEALMVAMGGTPEVVDGEVVDADD